MGSYEVAWREKAVNTKRNQKAYTGAIFTSVYHTKQLNPWPNSSASRLMNYSWLSDCQGKREPFKDHQIICGRLKASVTSHSKSRLGKRLYQYLAKLLVNVSSYELMEKSVVCCCVRGRQSFSNPVTHHDKFGVQ